MTIDISDNNPRIIYTVAQGVTQTSFAVPFEFFADSDLNVYVDSVLKTITTHYTVSGGDGSTGTVTMSVTGATGGSTVAITRDVTIERVTDFTPGVEINRAALNTQLDTLTAIAADIKDQALRAIRVQDFDPSTTGFEIPLAATRANKVFAFDSTGAVSITNEIGVYKGNWAASTSYVERDIVKDTSNNNIYLALVAHTSTGAQPISTNADVAKWALLVDAAAAATSASNAASSASAAASSASAASSSASAASSSASAAASSASAAASDASSAASSASSAAASYDSFDDRYLGAKSSDPTLDNDGNALIDGALYFDTANNVMKVYDLGTTTWLRTTPTSGDQANINTVSGISANVTTVAGISANVTTVAGISANVTTVAGVSANVTTVATDIANVNTVATNINSVNNFADSYVVSATEPVSPIEGMLWFDTSTDTMKVYNGSSFQNAGSSVNGTSERNVYTATGGQTSFAATYDPGFVDVYLNGVKLVDGTDFTATSGSAVVLTVGATSGDIVDIVAYGTFSLANVYTQAASDARYVQQTDIGVTVQAYDADTAKLDVAQSFTANQTVSAEFIATSYNETYVALSGTTPTVNCETGNMFALSTSGNTTFTFSNPPASGTAYGFTLKLTAGGTHTITWPASVDWAGGTAPDAPASGEVNVYAFITHDGGTNWYGFLAGAAMA